MKEQEIEVYMKTTIHNQLIRSNPNYK